MSSFPEATRGICSVFLPLHLLLHVHENETKQNKTKAKPQNGKQKPQTTLNVFKLDATCSHEMSLSSIGSGSRTTELVWRLLLRESALPGRGSLPVILRLKGNSTDYIQGAQFGFPVAQVLGLASCTEWDTRSPWAHTCHLPAQACVGRAVLPQ